MNNSVCRKIKLRFRIRFLLLLGKPEIALCEYTVKILKIHT